MNREPAIEIEVSKHQCKSGANDRACPFVRRVCMWGTSIPHFSPANLLPSHLCVLSCRLFVGLLCFCLFVCSQCSCVHSVYVFAVFVCKSGVPQHHLTFSLLNLIFLLHLDLQQSEQWDVYLHIEWVFCLHLNLDWLLLHLQQEFSSCKWMLLSRQTFISRSVNLSACHQLLDEAQPECKAERGLNVMLSVDRM